MNDKNDELETIIVQYPIRCVNCTRNIKVGDKAFKIKAINIYYLCEACNKSNKGVQNETDRK